MKPIKSTTISIENKMWTFERLLQEMDMLYPDGKVANFTLQMCRIIDIPNATGSVFSAKYVPDGKPILNWFLFKKYRIVIQKKKYQEILFGKFHNPKNIALINNVFTAKGFKSELI